MIGRIDTIKLPQIAASDPFLKVYSMGRFDSKVVYRKFVLFTKIGDDYSFKIKKQKLYQLYNNYESNKYIELVLNKI